MEVDKSIEGQLPSCRRDLVKPMSVVMDDHGALPHPASSALRVSTKSKAPSPPGLKKLDSPGLSQWYPGNPHLTMDQKENLIDRDLCLAVVLPGGEEKMTTVPGSKPIMDLLVTLCAKYHLNPSSYTLELVTTNRKKTKLKPNALIGTLDAEKVILKPKGEDKNKKPGPQMPEATVRMVINYRKTQKTILRVNPRVPLAEHLPAICEKCEFDVESTVLLRDVHSLAPLDLSCSLNDYAIREVYARDTKRQPMTPVSPVSPSHAGAVMPGKDKNQKEEENKGLFSKFRKSKKKSDQAMTVSAPASPVLASKPRPLSMALPSSNSSMVGSHSVLTDVPKKRRAPQPPVLVSQGCSSDLVARRRINSESNSQLDSDQTAGLSRGSSAENSLKRTKRKAPPPPPSPSTAVPETIPVEENLQGGAAANTLEEITEQEESTAAPMSATAAEPQGEDNVFSMATEVSEDSPPSPDTDTPSTRSVRSCGEDQSCDLSSDGNQPPSTMNESLAPSEDRIPEGTGTSEPAETSDSPCQFENVSQPITSEESAPVSMNGDCSTILPPPVIEDTETCCSVQADTETIQEQMDGLVNPATTSPSNEDGQVLTDITPLPLPSEELMENDSSSVITPVFDSAEQKDTATSTGEQDTPELKDALSHTSETSSCQDSTPSASAAKEAAAIYATTSEPKPKPSNELTRDYIPKVGMTTYTIVPQKSLEKLRYFEVALTLEQSLAAEEEGSSMGVLHLEEGTTPGEQTAVSEVKSELHSTVPREHLLTSITTATTQDSVNGTIPGSISSSSATSFPKADRASQAGSPARVKEVKIPPATKPKPGSFRLAQHKKIPGYYVTSAAEKSVSPQREAPASGERVPLSPPLPPPPPPPPMLCHEDTTGASNVELSPKADDKNATVMRITRQSSLPSKQPNFGLSLEKIRSFVAPRPYSPATPSRFAQAVSSAVKRSQSLSHHAPKSPSLPDSAPLSPVTSHASAMDSKGLSKLKDSTEMDGDKSATLVGGCKGPSLSGIVLMEGESSP